MFSKSCLEKVIASRKQDFWIIHDNPNSKKKSQVLLGTSLKSRFVSRNMTCFPNLVLNSSLLHKLIRAQKVLAKKVVFCSALRQLAHLSSVFLNVLLMPGYTGYILSICLHLAYAAAISTYAGHICIDQTTLGLGLLKFATKKRSVPAHLGTGREIDYGH